MQFENTDLYDRKPSPSQVEAVRWLPSNTESVWEPRRYTIPATHYTDPAHYALEQSKLFRKMPIPIGPSAMLAEPGSFVCHDGYGLAIILTRDKQGQVHAMVNACKHRGSRVADADAPAKARLFVCPYHAWSYDLSGKLVGVPRQDVFTSIEKSELGLTKLPCEERGGIIWVQLTPGEEGDFSNIGNDLVADLDALAVDKMYLFARNQHDVAGNWKLVLDTFLEGYHVIRLHAASLGSMYEDTITKVDRLGDHLRQTSGRIGYRKEMLPERENSVTQIRRVVTFVYTLFPNAAFIFSQDYVNLLVMQPQGHDRTIVDNFMLTNIKPEGEKLRGKWEKSLALTDGLAFKEDFAASASSQRGLETGVVKEMIVGGMEEAMEYFHRNLAARLA
jgi:Rieske 2Fe-2S family protein